MIRLHRHRQHLRLVYDLELNLLLIDHQLLHLDLDRELYPVYRLLLLELLL